MKTSELTGAALDWAVAKCLTLTGWATGFEVRDGKPMYLDGYWDDAHFHFDWAQGGPIIERELIAVWFSRGDWKSQRRDTSNKQHGPTPLIAAMRCYVASKLGDAIEIPEELK